ncbi:SpoIIE family protein phosphatase [Acidobacteriota bacterium]
MRKKRISPLNDVVWRRTLYVALGCLVAWLLRLLFGFDHIIPIWIVAFIAMASWIFAIRMLFLDARFKKLWMLWLGLSLLVVFLSPSSSGIWIVAISFAFIFLLFRLYKPYRHLTSKRRAALYLIGVIILGLLTVGWIGGGVERITIVQSGDTALEDEFLIPETVPFSASNFGQNLANYALWALRFFWFFSLLHLFLNIRLHFMKLKPKLAVSAILIAFVPFLLVNLIGVLVLYSTLGANRADRAKIILYDWAKLAAVDRNFVQIISGRSFSYETEGGIIRTEGTPPPWFPQFIQALKTDATRLAEWTASEKAQILWVDSDLWLIHLTQPSPPVLSAIGCKFDIRMMDRLAQILHSDVQLSFNNPIDLSLSQENFVQFVPPEERATQPAIRGRFEKELPTGDAANKAESSIFHKPFYFGMTHLDVMAFDKREFKRENILLITEISLASIASDLFSERNPLIMVVMIALLALGVNLLILEALALFFGIRITGGITSAVKALHKGTRRIAKGDFDIQIDIPNEDELGDLAISFNEMAAAVKKGQEEAIERERLERELSTAREIQEKLLPHEMPDVPGFEITGTSLPSQQVGGDYFDFLDIGDTRLGIAIADVSGKGIPAALLMANLQASLHAQVFQKGEVSEIAFRINNLLYKSTDAHMFVTFFYGILDRQRSLFTSTNAGHNPPLLFRSDGRIERLGEGGLILGFQPDVHYDQQTVMIEPGDFIVLYTDGITEAADPFSEMISDDQFGVERLLDVVRDNSSGSARKIQAAILEAITNHTRNAPQHDDITLVVIKRNT